MGGVGRFSRNKEKSQVGIEVGTGPSSGEASMNLILTMKCEWRLATKVKANTPGTCLATGRGLVVWGALVTTSRSIELWEKRGIS